MIVRSRLLPLREVDEEEWEIGQVMRNLKIYFGKNTENIMRHSPIILPRKK